MIGLEPAHLVGAGGVIGAFLRYEVSRRFDEEAFPLGTLLVNVVGSFVLGLATFAGVGLDLLLFIGVGACGSFTTFSSFSFQTVRLIETGRWGRGLAYAFGTLAASLLAVGMAYAVVGVGG